MHPVFFWRTIMRHIFLLKPVDDDYDHHPFIETIREVMQGYDYDIIPLPHYVMIMIYL